jgi:hypothetical protein
MNNPTSHAGYTLFQSGRDLSGGRRVSYLSVSRDPGQIIVFTGYVAVTVGMVVVLVTRALEKRRPVRPGGRSNGAEVPDHADWLAGSGFVLPADRRQPSPARHTDAVSRSPQ